MEPNILTHHLVSQIVNEDGTIVNEWALRDTPLELGDHHIYHEQCWREVRQERDKLLAETDWVVARAYEQGQPVPTAWAEYRQALRDVTLQHNPFFVVWPARPMGQDPQPATIMMAANEEDL